MAQRRDTLTSRPLCYQNYSPAKTPANGPAGSRPNTTGGPSRVYIQPQRSRTTVFLSAMSGPTLA